MHIKLWKTTHNPLGWFCYVVLLTWRSMLASFDDVAYRSTCQPGWVTLRWVDLAKDENSSASIPTAPTTTSQCALLCSSSPYHRCPTYTAAGYCSRSSSSCGCPTSQSRRSARHHWLPRTPPAAARTRWSCPHRSCLSPSLSRTPYTSRLPSCSSSAASHRACCLCQVRSDLLRWFLQRSSAERASMVDTTA
jgi:hypothetical protein